MNDNWDQPAMEPLAPDSYGQFLAELKSRIQAAQLRASLAVNRELVVLQRADGDGDTGRSVAIFSIGRNARSGAQR